MQGSFGSRTYNFNTILGRSSFPDLTVKNVVVPAFQRGYSWEKLHVLTFWEDVRQFHEQVGDKGAIDTYFLGPIVVMPMKSEVTLLDGQQRLATATILFAVIRDIARELGGQKGGDLARDIQRDLIYLDDEAETYALTLNELDREFFRELVQEDAPSNISPSLRSHVLIAQARTIVEGSVRALVAGMKATELVKALKLLRTTIAERIKLVVIEVSSEEEAFLIFETLNDRGLRLSVPDLLLNHLMKDAKHPADRYIVREKWDGVLEKMGTRQVSTFLRHMWVSTHGDVKAQSLYREIKQSLKKQDIDSVSFATTCSAECEKYVALLDFDKTVLKGSESNVRGIIKSLSGEMALPLLLSGFVCLNDNDFEKLSKAVVCLMVRYSVANLNPANLEEALYDIARDLRKTKETKSSGATLFGAKAALKKMDPSKKQIQEGAADFYVNKREAAFILTGIATKLQSQTKTFTFDKVSIEHIFPENADASLWSNSKTLSQYIWHLGNLTLLEPKLNKNLGDKQYSKKVPVYAKSEIKMTQIVASEYKEWDEKSVLARAKRLALTIDLVWNFE